MNLGNRFYDDSRQNVGPLLAEGIGVHGRYDIERTISSGLACFPERFLVSSSSDASLLRFVGVSTNSHHPSPRPRLLTSPSL